MNPLILTFAEIEFLLRGNPPRIPVREQLRLREPDDMIAAAGLASLLARGLCIREAEDVRPAKDLVPVIAAMSLADRGIRALGLVDDRETVVHLFLAAEAAVALSPAEFGQFTAELLDPAVPAAEQITRFVDACLPAGRESGVLVQAPGADEVSLAVARDETGAWFLSDSVNSPDRSEPSSHAAVVERIATLFSSGRLEPIPR
jgi:hypothetical protein